MTNEDKKETLKKDKNDETLKAKYRRTQSVTETRVQTPRLL